jgi:Uma2 family endonuclease
MTDRLAPIVTSEGLILEFPDSIDMSGERFFDFCVANRDLRIERTARGEILVMPPNDTETGRRNAELNYRLCDWANRDGTGVVFDSSTGFELPNGAMRSPDVSWVLKSRLKGLPKKRKGFAAICPDFVVELRSPSDRLITAKKKMEEYIENGARLGWLIDPMKKRVYIYRPGVPVEERSGLKRLEAGPLLPGFTLDLGPIWAEEL